MADRVMPFARLIFPVRGALLDLADEKWLLRDPLVMAQPPRGKPFPFRMPQLAVFVQLTGGLGRWEIGMEVRQRRDEGSYRFVGISPMEPIEFESGPRLMVKATAFLFKKLPFKEEGLYEFRVVAQTSDDSATPTYEVLNGPVAELRVLDHRGTV